MKLWTAEEKRLRSRVERMRTLTPEDRHLVADIYRLMVRDAETGDADALDALADPFWQFYADVFLGGYDVVMQAVKRNIRAQTK